MQRHSDGGDNGSGVGDREGSGEEGGEVVSLTAGDGDSGREWHGDGGNVPLGTDGAAPIPARIMAATSEAWRRYSSVKRG